MGVTMHLLIIIFVTATFLFLGGYRAEAVSTISQFFAVNETSQSFNRTSALSEKATPNTQGGIVSGNNNFFDALGMMLSFFIYLFGTPILIFTDPIMPFAVRLILGGAITLMWIGALAGLITGRDF